MGTQPSDFLRYVYGPVTSRRLGMSLGVDLVPAKICTLDCIYCQVGRTTEKSTKRRAFAPISEVLSEVRERLESGARPDHITIGGSGEPTLHSRVGDLIDGLHGLSDVPVAMLTNGTLLDRPDVRADCVKADVILPSLDAPDEETFRKIARPDPSITIENAVSGLVALRNEYHGPIWLEVFLVGGVNTSEAQIARLQQLIRRIRPDKVHLNTAVRPPRQQDLPLLGPEKLQDIASRLGPNCEVIVDLNTARCACEQTLTPTAILSVLKRRPSSAAQLAAGLGASDELVCRYLRQLEATGRIVTQRRGSIIYYRIVR